jgi:transposase-like protein
MSTHPPVRRPPFCPNPQCDSRKNPPAWRYTKKGFYPRDCAPKRVQRYQCSHCFRYFSSQTFAVTYWLKRGDLLESTFHRLVSCSGMRQIARETGVSHSTIRRLSDRLGRHCLLFQEAMKPKGCPNEPIVLDGFRTFEHSQYWPMDLNWVVGTSLFVYGFNDAELRRSGTMRPAQAVKRTILRSGMGARHPRRRNDRFMSCCSV